MSCCCLPPWCSEAADAGVEEHWRPDETRQRAQRQQQQQRISSLATDGAAATWPYTSDLTVRLTADPAIDRLLARLYDLITTGVGSSEFDGRLDRRQCIARFIVPESSECCDRQQFRRRLLKIIAGATSPFLFKFPTISFSFPAIFPFLFSSFSPSLKFVYN